MKRVVVIGGGEIGAGWAALFNAHGADVAVVDVVTAALPRVQAASREVMALGVGRGRPGALTVTRDLDPALATAEWIQEAAPETLELKQSLLARIEEIAPATAVIASSTSSLTRAQVAERMRQPSRLVIVHPLHPVYAVPIVEVNADAALPTADVERILEVLRSLGREPVLVKGDLPGLVSNRLTAALLRESLDLIARGVVTAADLDRIVARGIATGWVARGPLATEITGGALARAEELPAALETALASLWPTLAAWTALDDEARAAVERSLRQSLGRIQKAHAAGESTWAKTLSRVARAAEVD